MGRVIGFVLLLGAGAGFAYATIVYVYNLRLGAVDQMGNAIRFDQIWIAAAALASVGVALMWQLQWGWGVAVFGGCYFTIIPYKMLVAWLARRMR